MNINLKNPLARLFSITATLDFDKSPSQGREVKCRVFTFAHRGIIFSIINLFYPHYVKKGNFTQIHSNL